MKITKEEKHECPECGRESHNSVICRWCMADQQEHIEDREDAYEHMSVRDQEMNDRLDYAREVEQAGDPERAAEIRMGA